MPLTRQPLIAGNWKMCGLRADLTEIEAMAVGARRMAAKLDLAVCPPTTLLLAAAGVIGDAPLRLGGQDCHTDSKGAHTGDVSAAMLADAGAAFAIVGHSERRQSHKEASALVAEKARAALAAGLTPIVCVGESAAERQAGQAEAVVVSQLNASLPEEADARVVVAYEPVWAIGTGLTPTPADIAAMHARLREALRLRLGRAADAVRVLYGGSVKPANAAEILALPEVDGALVGGASLKAEDFLAIAAAHPALSAVEDSR